MLLWDYMATISNHGNIVLVLAGMDSTSGFVIVLNFPKWRGMQGVPCPDSMLVRPKSKHLKRPRAQNPK